MCQIHIINKSNFLKDTDAYEGHLNAGAAANDHGSSALFIDADGNHSLIRSMKFDTILDMLHLNDFWETVVIHQRYTTQGATNLSNTHLWQVGNYFYCHNGVLRDPESEKYPVDSQLIGHYLETNPWEAIAYCQSEDYANTIIVGLDEKKIWITKSKTNDIYSDGNGQFSSKLLAGKIDKRMANNSVEILNLNIEDFEAFNYYSRYDKFGSYDHNYGGHTYEERVASATQGRMKQTTMDDIINRASDIPADDYDEFGEMSDIGFDYETYGSDNVIEIEREMNEGHAPSADDVLELEQALHNAIANKDELGERKYNYLLEKANGNG